MNITKNWFGWLFETISNPEYEKTKEYKKGRYKTKLRGLTFLLIALIHFYISLMTKVPNIIPQPVMYYLAIPLVLINAVLFTIAFVNILAGYFKIPPVCA